MEAALESAAPASSSARSSGVAAASEASNSCRTIPNANSPSSSPPRALKNLELGHFGESACLGHQSRLPDSCAALDDHQAAVTAACRRKHRFERSQLRFALEQLEAGRSSVGSASVGIPVLGVHGGGERCAELDGSRMSSLR